MRNAFWALVGAAVVATGMAWPASAKTFRWANDADSNSMDPYARQETFLLSFDSNMYEPLVRRSRDLKLEPGLATEWSQVAPEVWRFKLRRGVTFHDGTPFTADDVLFSFERVRNPGSNLTTVLATVKAARKLDDFTVELVTNGPDPILPNEITVWDIMSKAWCEKHNTVRAADITKNEESYATNHENGTGPFVLKEREPDVKTVLVRNPHWWDKPQHNLDEVVFQRVSNAATRVAALLSGELDMIYSVPPQDTDRISKTQGLRVAEGPELRTVFLGFDQSRDELLESSVKGKNPYKDRRVRQAFYQAIDEAAIKSKVMRGFATPAALMIGPGVNGFDPTLNQRFPYDPAASKKLLAEAGYPEGFETGMDCPTDRYVNDEAICQAVVAMLARVGVKARLLAQTRAKFFAKVLPPSYQTSFFLLGWSPATYDAHNMLLNLVHSRDPQTHAGEMNVGGYANPSLDKLIGEIQVEPDKEKRLAQIHDALKAVKDDFAYIPLHQQAVVWAVKDNVDVALQADNFFQLRYVKVR
jgi:peptide/nickel transport system substrate-binding protein